MKKIISISIIAFSVFLGMIIIGRFSASEDTKKTEALGYKILPENKNGGEKFIESLSDIKNQDLGKKQENPENNLTNKAIESASLLNDNITQQIANQIGQKMIGGAKDVNSLMQDLKSGNPEIVKTAYALTDDIITQKSNEFGPEALKTRVNPNELNLINDTSRSAFSKYVSDFILALKDINSINGTLKEIEDKYDLFIKNLKKIKTPIIYVNFHSRAISILEGIKNGFSEIEESSSDPAKRLIIIQSISELNKQFEDLLKNPAL